MWIWIYNTFRVITDLKLVFRAITWGWWFCSALLVKWFEGPRWSRKMERAWSGIFVDAGWYFWILGMYIIYCHIHLWKDANLSLSRIFSKTLRCRDFFQGKQAMTWNRQQLDWGKIHRLSNLSPPWLRGAVRSSWDSCAHARHGCGHHYHLEKKLLNCSTPFGSQ